MNAPAPVIYGLLDDLVARFADTGDSADLVAARADHDERRGRVFEDEDLWESWSQAFLEWYVLERPLAGSGATPDGSRPPAVLALAEQPDPESAAALRALCRSHRSLFEIRALRPGGVDLHDLIGGGEFRVDEARALYGVEVGDVAELRLVGFAGRVLFGRTFCYHPTGTRDAIARHVARIRSGGGDRRQAMDFCAGLRVRCERYRHVQAVRVYEAADGSKRGAAPA